MSKTRNDGITKRDDFDGLYWPDYDHKPDAAFPFVMRHLPDIDKTIPLCAQKRLVIQAGGHVGLWPIRLQASFRHVISFEPDPVLFQCMFKNINLKVLGNGLTPDALRPEIYQRALGAECGSAKILGRRSSAGSSRIEEIEPNGIFDLVEMVTIDSLGLAYCDAIFLDVEGYEPEVLKGAAKTIEQFRPVLHVEELKKSGNPVRDMILSLGYRLHHEVHKDAVYTWAR